MDALTIGLVQGLVTSGLYDALKYAGRQGWQWLAVRGNEKESKLSEGDEFFDPDDIAQYETIHDVVMKGIDRFTTTYGSLEAAPADRDLIAQFLSTPEAEAIVRQAYATELSKRDVSGHANTGLEMVRQTFSAAFRLFVSSQGRFLDPALERAATLTCDSLISACTSVLSAAAEHGVLAAHEALSAQRQMILLDELEGVKKLLAMLTAANQPSQAEIVEFEQKYRELVAQRHAYITPQNFDTARKVPIDELYVYPSFLDATAIQRDKRTKRSKRNSPYMGNLFDADEIVLNTPMLLARAFRLVILGNPGGGKSTFARKLCYDLASRYSDRLFANRLATPVLVVLRDYGVARREQGYSIRDYLEARARTDYQIDPPVGAFEYLLTTGRVAAIFDGLDELLDTSYRQEISSDIEVFCARYPSVPVVVTSRQVGYDQAPLDPRRFSAFRLADFNHRQMTEYVFKWFASDVELNVAEQRHKAEGFLSESAGIDDLRSNPLMLSLMCTLYSGQGYIPQNRPEVYEKCATLLFERWDKSRSIRHPLPYEAYFERVIQHVAYWILNDEQLRGGVREDQIVQKVAEYLCPRLIESMDEALRVAEEYITFCRGRAWILTDTGTTPSGNHLYQFAHQTFLEYFAARYLVGTYPTPEKLKRIILPKIAKQEWDMVAQLAFQLQDRRVDGAGDKLLIELMSKAERTNGVRQKNQRRNLLLFGARMLHYMLPSQTVTRKLVTACADEIFTASSDGDEEYHSDEWGTGWSEILSALMNVAIANSHNVVSILSAAIVSRIGNGDVAEAKFALELCAHELHDLIPVIRDDIQSATSTSSWSQVCTNVYRACAPVCVAQAKTDLPLAYHAVLKHIVSIEDFLAWHGTKSLFANITHTIMYQEDASLSQKLLSDVNYIRELDELGRLTATGRDPWLRSPLYQNWLVESPSPFEAPLRDVDEALLTPSAIFGCFCILAAWLELAVLSTPSRHDLSLEQLQGATGQLGGELSSLLQMRFRPEDFPTSETEIAMGRFTVKQCELVRRWIAHEFNFIQFDPNAEFKLSIYNWYDDMTADEVPF